jgi:Tol biopolymer transport system component
MGEVYRALDTRLERPVAIKILPEAFAADPDRLARFEREAKALAALNHPNIAAIYGLEQNALVMEMVEGQDLPAPLPLESALDYARQIAEALEAAHEKGIVHRDLKPANIRVTPAGVIKILDFGLAAMASHAADGSTNASLSPTLTIAATQAGMILGTASYMSPEQAAGRPVDKRADIWSFGVVLWEMLCGRKLFQGETISHTLADVLRAPIDLAQLPSNTPAPVHDLMGRCLDRDLKTRLRDIGEARIVLQRWLSNPVPQQPVATPAPPAAAQRTPRWLAAAANMLAIGLAALAAVHFAEKPPEPAATRFQIPPPENAAFGNGMAISPDGKRIAFAAVGVNGKNMLWVRALDSLDMRVLPETEALSSFPFWSPDSRFIGFFATGKLKKIEASGGPPQTLCEVSNTGIGGSWNRDGVIVFGTNQSGLFRVPQAGGAASPLTTLDAGRGELFHGRPWFLPDGRRYLYFANSSSKENSAIYLGALDSRERKRLVGARQGGAYVPPANKTEKGHLLFLRDDTLMAQPLDPGSYNLAGDPFPVAEQVGSYISNPYFSVSANGILIYRSGGGGNYQLAWYDREGKPLGTLGTVAPAGLSNDVSLSPDGKRVAVSRRDSVSATSDIWLLDVSHGVPTRFTFDPADDSNPVWSPDGNRMVFSSTRDGTRNLYQKGAGGTSGEEPLLKTALAKFPYDWSADGRYLIYTVVAPTTKRDLWLLPDPGGSGEHTPRPFLVTPYNEGQGQFSPEAAGTRWIAYTSDESGKDDEVYVQPLTEGTSQPPGKFQISSGGGRQPRWRHDGKELYYLALDGKLMAVDITTAPRFEHTVPRDLFQTRIIGDPVNLNLYFRYAPSSDGKRFLLIAPQQEAASSPITVLLNWTAALKR